MHAAIKIREPIYDDGIREDDSEHPIPCPTYSVRA